MWEALLIPSGFCELHNALWEMHSQLYYFCNPHFFTGRFTSPFFTNHHPIPFCGTRLLLWSTIHWTQSLAPCLVPALWETLSPSRCLFPGAGSLPQRALEYLQVEYVHWELLCWGHWCATHISFQPTKLLI